MFAETDQEMLTLKAFIEDLIDRKQGGGDVSSQDMPGDVEKIFIIQHIQVFEDGFVCQPVARKAFYLLKQVLAERGLRAIAKIVLRDREQLAAIDPFASTMLLSTLYWPAEVRSAGELQLPEAEIEVKPAELAMAQQLVDAMAGDFDAAAYRDEYREALLDIIEAKADGAEIAQPAPAPAGKVTDLMAALEASVAAAKAARASGAPQTMAEAKARPARKTAPKPPAEEDAKEAAPVRRRRTA